MRDIAVFIYMIFFIPMAATNIFVAYLLWGWVGLVSLNEYLYGRMAAVPFVQVFAIITLVLLPFRMSVDRISFRLNRTSMLFIFLIIHCFLCALFAYPGLTRSWELFMNMFKTVVFCLLMPALVASRYRIHALVIAICIGVGYHGILDGLKFVASGGGHLALGVSKFGDNNHYAMVLVMVLPLFLYLYQYSRRRIVQIGFVGGVVVICFALIATNSRGGLLSLMATALWIVLKSRQKFKGLVAIGVVSLLMLQLAPERWFDRMDTIQSADSDASFMGRVTAWKRASAIALENPVFGGGLHAGQAQSIFEIFRYKEGLLGFVTTPNVGYAAASHSIYFEVLGDMGFVGLFIFLLCIANAFVTLREIRKMVKIRGPGTEWALDLANLLAASLIAFVIGGSALSAAYFELPYFVIMLLEVVKINVSALPQASE